MQKQESISEMTQFAFKLVRNELSGVLLNICFAVLL